jgi:putative glutamine amidotransferase
MGKPKPLIAVPAYHLASGRITRWEQGGFAAPEWYVDGIMRAGGRAALLASPDEGDAAEILDRFDGLMLIGGGDIDPFLYDTEPHDLTYGMNRDRDLLEIALARTAAERGVPTLGICRGIQIANVAFGGSLIQHLPDLGITRHGVPNGHDGAYVADPKRIEPGSRLAAALGGATDLTAMCSHHQGIDRVGDGLREVAWSEPGLVEGLERDDGWFVTVQWHPEVTAATDPIQQGLFDALVREAARR